MRLVLPTLAVGLLSKYDIGKIGLIVIWENGEHKRAVFARRNRNGNSALLQQLHNLLGVALLLFAQLSLGNILAFFCLLCTCAGCKDRSQLFGNFGAASVRKRHKDKSLLAAFFYKAAVFAVVGHKYLRIGGHKAEVPVPVFQHLGYLGGGLCFCLERGKEQLLYLKIVPLGNRQNHGLRLSERPGKRSKQLAAVREALETALPAGIGKNGLIFRYCPMRERLMNKSQERDLIFQNITSLVGIPSVCVLIGILFIELVIPRLRISRVRIGLDERSVDFLALALAHHSRHDDKACIVKLIETG